MLNLKVDEIYHIKINCMNCGKGDKSTPEENQDYWNTLHDGNGLVINQNLLVEKACDNCGCNMVCANAKIKLKVVEQN